MKLRKEAGMTFSKRFADNSILSVTFNAAKEITVSDKVDTKKVQARLQKEVFEALEADIAAYNERSDLSKNVHATVRRAIKLEKRVHKTEQRLKDFD